MRIVLFVLLVQAIFGSELSFGAKRDPKWREIGAVSIHDDLEILRKICNREEALFIDRIHRFTTLPSLQWIQAEILKINPAYQLWVIGDSAVISPTPLQPTDLVKACTVSRLFMEGDPITPLLEAENKIQQTAPFLETKALDQLMSLLANDPRRDAEYVHILLWKGLTEMGRSRHWEAPRYFLRVGSLGYTHWRIAWYLANCYFRLRELDEAACWVREVIEKAPDFAPAHKLLFLIKRSNTW
jgi:tetratricopeptide (TPR) repeat protein